MLAICKTIAIPLLCMYGAPGKPLSLDPGAYQHPPQTVKLHHRVAAKPWRVTKLKGPGGKYYQLADQFAYCTCRWSIPKIASAR